MPIREWFCAPFIWVPQYVGHDALLEYDIVIFIAGHYIMREQFRVRRKFHDVAS